MIELIKRRIGAIKILSERAMVQGFRLVTVINTILLINVSTLLGADLLQYIPMFALIVVGSLIYVLADLFIILPSEQSFTFDKNPKFVEMMNDVKEIKRKMK